MGQFNHPNVIKLVGVVTKSKWDKRLNYFYQKLRVEYHKNFPQCHLEVYYLLAMCMKEFFLLIMNLIINIFVGRPMMILTEFLESGSLDKFLKVAW